MSRQRAESASAALLTTCSRRTAPGARSGGLVRHLRHLTSNRLSRSRPGLLPRTTAAAASPYECRRNYVAPWDVFPRPKKIAVVGGGLTGLVTAFYLARDLPESSKIVVYEASDRWGGWINTQIINPQVEGRGNCKVLLETGPRVFSTHNRYDLMVFHDLVSSLLLCCLIPTDLLSRNTSSASTLKDSDMTLNAIFFRGTHLSTFLAKSAWI